MALFLTDKQYFSKSTFDRACTDTHLSYFMEKKLKVLSISPKLFASYVLEG